MKLIQTRPPVPQYQPFSFFEGELDANECDWLIEEGKKRGFYSLSLRDEQRQEVEPGRLQVEAHRIELLDDIVPEPPIAKMLSCAVEANQMWWRFDVDECSAIEVMRYRTGHEYMPHADLWTERRYVKLAAVAFLSDPKDYEGGAFQVLEAGQVREVPMTRGTIVVLPSYITHQVTEVKSGERWSAVAWVDGPPFR